MRSRRLASVVTIAVALFATSHYSAEPRAAASFRRTTYGPLFVRCLLETGPSYDAQVALNRERLAQNRVTYADGSPARWLFSGRCANLRYLGTGSDFLSETRFYNEVGHLVGVRVLSDVGGAVLGRVPICREIR